MAATELGRRDVVELFLNYGADINSTNEDGNSISSCYEISVHIYLLLYLSIFVFI